MFGNLWSGKTLILSIYSAGAISQNSIRDAVFYNTQNFPILTCVGCALSFAHLNLDTSAGNYKFTEIYGDQRQIQREWVGLQEPLNVLKTLNYLPKVSEEMGKFDSQ